MSVFNSKVQKNFKKQMKQVESDMHKQARKGKGVFSNKLFTLRFYGYNYYPSKHSFNFFKFLFRLILFVIKLAFIIAIVIVLIILFLFAFTSFI